MKPDFLGNPGGGGLKSLTLLGAARTLWLGQVDFARPLNKLAKNSKLMRALGQMDHIGIIYCCNMLHACMHAEESP